MNLESIETEVTAYHRVRFAFDPEDPLLDPGAGYGEFSRFVRASRDSAVCPIPQPVTEPLPLPDRTLGTVFASSLFEHLTPEDGARIPGKVLRGSKPTENFWHSAELGTEAATVF